MSHAVSFYFSIARLGSVQCLYRVMQRCRKTCGGDFALANLRAAKQNGAQPYPLSGTRSAYDSATNVVVCAYILGCSPPSSPASYTVLALIIRRSENKYFFKAANYWNSSPENLNPANIRIYGQRAQSFTYVASWPRADQPQIIESVAQENLIFANWWRRKLTKPL